MQFLRGFRAIIFCSMTPLSSYAKTMPYRRTQSHLDAFLKELRTATPNFKITTFEKIFYFF